MHTSRSACICNHSHHTVYSHEAVVKVEGTAHLMSQENMNDLTFLGKKLIPSTWMTVCGGVVPMELGIIPNTFGISMILTV